MTRAKLCFWGVSGLVLLMAPAASATIRYTVSLDRPEQHIFHVRMEIPKARAGTEVAIPAWNALYQIRDFAYRIGNVRAHEQDSPGVALAIRKLDKETWQINDVTSAGSAVVIEYSAEWDERGPFNSQLDSHHAFLNFAEVLMYVPDRRGEDAEVDFENIPPEWQVAAELPAAGHPNAFTASSYDALVDAPAEAGKFEQFTFDHAGAHFRVIVDATDWNKIHLEAYLRSITEYESHLMNGVPFQQYTFFFHINPDADIDGGGMEHSYSTAIAASSTEIAAAIAAHEFFHAWNVKRIRPQMLEPVDYTREQYTRALWFAEGVTSTYAAFALERTGLWSRDQFYADLGRQIETLESRSARKTQSVEEASTDTWLEKYSAYTRPERSISYYNKGQILGVLLDLSIREATDNHRSLDDVLRRMNEEYAQQGRFYEDSDGIRAVIEEVSGTSHEDFFRRYVSGTDDIPYESFLSAAGLEWKTTTAKTARLGFVTSVVEKVARVSSLQSGSAAEEAGLQNGDIILAVNEKRAARRFDAMLREIAPGNTAALRIERNGRELDISFVVGSRDDHRYSVAEVAHPTEKQLRIREGLLRGVTD